MTAMLLACPYCLSDTASRNNDATTWTLLFMLGVLVVMFTGISAVVYTLVKRNRAAQSTEAVS
jgi:heme A synthase